MRGSLLVVAVLAACSTRAASRTAATSPTVGAAPAPPVATAPAPSMATPIAPTAAPAPVTRAPRPACSNALVAFAESGRLHEVEQLLEREACSGDGFDGARSPLMAAAAHGHLDVVRTLLAAGAHVDAATPKDHPRGGPALTGRTALYYAVLADHAAIADALLRAGADPNHRAADGVSLLALATQHELPTIARLLIEAHIVHPLGSDAEIMGHDGGPSALVLAYLERIGMSSESLPVLQRDSLHWEAAHQPRADASDDDRARFFAEVLRRAASRKALHFAIRHLAELPDQEDVAVPALLAVATSPPLEPLDRSPIEALHALHRFLWSSDLDGALPALLRLTSSDAGRDLRIAATELIGERAPVQAAVVDALLAKLRAGPERDWAARALGLLLQRASPGPAERSLMKRAVQELKRAALAGAVLDCHDAASCERAEVAQSARISLRWIGE